jgi:hypothetical protein
MSRIALEFVIPNKEYVPLLQDVLRMVTLQVVIQFLCYINTDDTPFLSVDFLLLVIYVILGVCVYWLIIKKLVIFK